MINTHADDIWYNGIVETLEPGHPVAEAFAAINGRIVAVGADIDILNLVGPDTRLCDLHGRYVMPGLVESHSHALWGACRQLFDMFVGYQASFDQLISAVRIRAEGLATGEAVFGGPWRLDMREAMGACPREILDQITTSHPVILYDTTQHSIWCNSLALNKAGLTANSPNIAGGVIERDPSTGEPTGILAESASAKVRQLAIRSESQLHQAAKYFVRYFNSLGITAFKEPMAFETDMQVYKNADLKGELTLHMAAHLVRTSPMAVEVISYHKLEKIRRKYASKNVRTGYAKLFLDGVAPSHTASFIEPYLAESGYDITTHNPGATLLIDPDELNQTVSELDRRGFVIKMHAVGDYAARSGLDAIETARRRNGASGLRHEIAHSAFISDEDLPRFRKLDAVAEVSPKLWFPNPATAAQIAVLGTQRLEKCHRIRDLLNAGAEVIYGSDWPAAAPDANPWTGLAGMISRQDSSSNFTGMVGETQAISLKEALPIFTINGARSLGMETETGSLAAGKWADFIVLDESLNNKHFSQIGATEIKQTFWKGQLVFAK